MPRLKRLLREAVASHSADADTGTARHGDDSAAADGDDLLDMTAEQLFSENLHSQKLLQIRKQAAVICAAKPIRMSALLDSSSSPDSQFPAQRKAPLQNADMSYLEDCIELAVSVALEGQRVLFLVSNLPLISKLLAAALQQRHASTLSHSTASGDLPLSEAFYAPLQRISLIQCRDVFQALCELSEVQRMWKEQSDGYRLLVLAPLCELLGPFATSSGLNSTGEGMRRMLQLALKRARASVPVQIRVIQPLLVSATPAERTGDRPVGALRNVDAHDHGEDDDDDK